MWRNWQNFVQPRQHIRLAISALNFQALGGTIMTRVPNENRTTYSSLSLILIYHIISGVSFQDGTQLSFNNLRVISKSGEKPWHFSLYFWLIAIWLKERRFYLQKVNIRVWGFFWKRISDLSVLTQPTGYYPYATLSHWSLPLFCS